MMNGSNGRPTVLVVGGGYGGIKVAKALDDIAEVTLLDPKEAFVHNMPLGAPWSSPSGSTASSSRTSACSPKVASCAVALRASTDAG
jgi:hypothetical protein